jgi:hypothetical protein
MSVQKYSPYVQNIFTNSYAGGSLATGRSPKPDRLIWVGTRQREIPWSSRLGVGREANNLTP